jgi:hypothetical protein
VGTKKSEKKYFTTMDFACEEDFFVKGTVQRDGCGQN